MHTQPSAIGQDDHSHKVRAGNCCLSSSPRLVLSGHAVPWFLNGTKEGGITYPVSPPPLWPRGVSGQGCWKGCCSACPGWGGRPCWARGVQCSCPSGCCCPCCPSWHAHCWLKWRRLLRPVLRMGESAAGGLRCVHDAPSPAATLRTEEQYSQ